MPKFSALAVAALAADNAVTQAHAALVKAQADDDQAHAALVSALKSQTPPKAAIVDAASGSIGVYTLDATGSGYVVEVFGGDFDVAEPAPAPVEPAPAPVEPAPAPAPAPIDDVHVADQAVG